MDKIIVKANTDMQRVIDWSEKLTGAAIALPFATADIEFQDLFLYCVAVMIF